jgi:hypothetical protein
MKSVTVVVAFVAAGVALVVAMTGTAVAQPDAGVTPAQVRTIAKAVANAEITRRAPALAVRSAITSNAPALYAQITASGGVTTNSRGISRGSVVRPAVGFYCFSGLPGVPKGGVATLDTNAAGGGSGVDLAQVGVGTIDSRWGSCPAGTQAHVVTFNPDTGFADEPFFVVFWY